MSNKGKNFFKYLVPFLALTLVGVHFALVHVKKLTPWKGGGFGMYSDIHFYYNEVYVTPIGQSLDSLAVADPNIFGAINTLKRMPSSQNLQKYAPDFYRYANSDSITIQVWKPKVNAQNATYTREIVNQYTYSVR